MKKLYIFGLMAVSFAACKTNIEPKAPEKGDADFSNYLAVGSSHTSGFTDGTMYRNGQVNSYPNILAEQLKTVGGGNFKQPLVPGEHGYPLAKRILNYVQGPCDTIPAVMPTAFRGALDTVGTSNNIYGQGPFNNMGIPGIRVIDYNTSGYAMANIFAYRMFKNLGAKPATELLNAQHTFFTMWEGINDVLNYGTSGGDVTAPSPINMITGSKEFAVAYDSVLSTAARNGAKGVVLSVPNILEMPFFTTIPPAGLQLNALDANKLNVAYNGTQVHFEAGANYFVIQDDAAPNGFRQIQAGEYVLLSMPMDSVKCRKWGSAVPIPSKYVITKPEVAKIQAAIADFNGIIIKLASDKQIPVLDIRNFFTSAKENGEKFNGANYTVTFVSGGIYSLDGIHLTGRGNAMLANQIIDRINGFYGSSIPHADVNKYEGIRIP